MGNIGPTQLLIVGVVLIILFGASRLPATAKGLGQAVRIFKKEVRDDDKPQADATAESSDTAASAGATPTESITTPDEPPSTPSADETKRAES